MELAKRALSQISLVPLYGGGFWVAFTQLVVFYYSVGALLHSVLPRVIPVHGIQQQQRKKGEVLRDALYSIGPLAIKAGVWAAVEQLHARGLSLTYTGRVSGWTAWAYVALCVALLDYLHDTWFYWTHRLLHWKPLYVHVHYIHHKSKAPSAFTGYSFHVIEALIVFANEVLVCFMFPLHMGLHRAYHLYTTLIHEGGHVGYELAPFLPTLAGVVALACRGLQPCAALNTVQHHDMHHRYPTKHFSLYFTHWDRLCGTLHPAYDRDLFHYFPPKAAAAAAAGAGAGAGAAGQGGKGGQGQAQQQNGVKTANGVKHE
ncbi:hypothetical protein HXX76_005049 [Chlamydomonas incerta]|uniref:Fatty acid hydroxylase domain-containing protein n=1 Tax=Chlamydomonas incerta TaxID=51695 RepID=A0A835T8T9_CHLIN|nr:hypothetical protein HXX76_005049 [Chlamydomonas incerta]|eukprot:KAG2438498.1 hypothetical protein HXX76_005049 [Chlamydomonas incerta]